MAITMNLNKPQIIPKEHNLYNLQDRLNATADTLAGIEMKISCYIGDHTKANEALRLITELLATIKSLTGEAKAVQGFLCPISQDILTSLVELRDKMSQWRCSLEDSQGGNGVCSRSLYNTAIPSIISTASKYSTIIRSIGWKVKAIRELQAGMEDFEQDTEPLANGVIVGPHIDPKEVMEGINGIKDLIRKQSGQGQTKDSFGCVPEQKYRWQTVLRKIEKHWKKLKAEARGRGETAVFPSFRSIAKALNENAGTVKKAIGYSRPLSRAYNKDKPAGKKIKFIDPSKLDYVGPKAGKRGGGKDPVYEEEKDRLLKEIKRVAKKDVKKLGQISGWGGIVMDNLGYISTFNNDRLSQLLTALKENRKNLREQLKATFKQNSLN